MYICVKTNENLDNLVQDLLRLNLAIKVDRHSQLTWIEVKLKDYGYLAYVDIFFKEVVIHTSTTDETLMKISFDNLVTIYDID